MCRVTAEVLLVTIVKSHKLSNSLTCWNWYLYFTAENGMITNWDLENSRATTMNTGWAMTTSMTCLLEVQVSSLHRFLSNLHEVVHLTGHRFVFRRELIKDWPDGLAWGKTLCHLWKFPAWKWAGKKWSEWWFACIICHTGAPACAASDFSTRAAKLTCSGALGFLVWLTDKQPWEQGREPGTSSSQPLGAQASGWQDHVCSLANSAAGHRDSHVCLPAVTRVFPWGRS